MPVGNIIAGPDRGFCKSWEGSCYAAQCTFDASGSVPHILTVGTSGLSAVIHLSWYDNDEKACVIRDVMNMLGGKCQWYIFTSEAYYLVLSDDEVRVCGGHLPSPTLDPDSKECLIIVGHSADGESRSVRWDIARDGEKASLVNRCPSSSADVWRDLWFGLLVHKEIV